MSSSYLDASQPSTTATVSSSSQPSRPWDLDVFCYPDNLKIRVVKEKSTVFEERFQYQARIVKKDGKLFLFLCGNTIDKLERDQMLVEKIFFTLLGKDENSRKKTMEIFRNEKKRKATDMGVELEDLEKKLTNRRNKILSCKGPILDLLNNYETDIHAQYKEFMNDLNEFFTQKK